MQAGCWPGRLGPDRNGGLAEIMGTEIMGTEIMGEEAHQLDYLLVVG